MNGPALHAPLWATAAAHVIRRMPIGHYRAVTLVSRCAPAPFLARW